MTGLEKFTGILDTSLSTLWSKVAGFVPQLFAAILIFIVGWFVAIIIAKVAWHIIKAIKMDQFLERVGFRAVWERSGYKLDTPMFFYELVKWFVIIFSLMVATEILGLARVTEFLGSVVEYLPNVFIAAFVILIGVLVAGFVEKSVSASVKAAQLGRSAAIAAIAKWAILIFSFLIAIEHLGIGERISEDVSRGVIAMIALALGLSFGLGGKAFAEKSIDRLSKAIKD